MSILKVSPHLAVLRTDRSGRPKVVHSESDSIIRIGGKARESLIVTVGANHSAPVQITKLSETEAHQSSRRTTLATTRVLRVRLLRGRRI